VENAKILSITPGILGNLPGTARRGRCGIWKVQTHIRLLLAAFSRIASVLPGIKAAQDRVDMRKAVFEEDFRRTGA
jgi:hypothetical protein